MPPPTTNLIVQLDVGSFSGSDNDPIGTLTDQSGNGNDGTGAGSARPTYKTGIVNGLPVARFTSPNRLGTPASASLTAYTCLAVIKPSGTSGYRPILGSDGGNGGLLWDLETTTNAQRLVKTFVSNVGTSTSGVPTSGFSVVAFTFTAATDYAFYLNGTVDGTATHGVTFNSGLTLNVGNSPPDGTRFEGDLAELLVYNAALSSTNLGLATSYLGTKYAITVAGPDAGRQHRPQEWGIQQANRLAAHRAQR